MFQGLKGNLKRPVSTEYSKKGSKREGVVEMSDGQDGACFVLLCLTSSR